MKSPWYQFQTTWTDVILQLTFCSKIHHKNTLILWYYERWYVCCMWLYHRLELSLSLVLCYWKELLLSALSNDSDVKLFLYWHMNHFIIFPGPKQRFICINKAHIGMTVQCFINFIRCIRCHQVLWSLDFSMAAVTTVIRNLCHLTEQLKSWWQLGWMIAFPSAQASLLSHRMNAWIALNLSQWHGATAKQDKNPLIAKRL